MRFVGILNRDGGTFRTLDVEDFARRATVILGRGGISLDCRVVDGESLLAEVDRAAADPGVDAIMVGGGDGTIAAAAAICHRTGATIAVLPGGTMNFFARALRVPLDLEEALYAIAGGRRFSVDIATANGRPFLNQYSVGLHARLVRIRDGLQYRGRVQKMLAGLRAIAGAVSRPLRFEVEINTPAGPQRRLASGVVVSNNLLAEGHLPFSDDLTGGVLGVYVAKPMTTGETLRLIVQVLLGRWKAHPRVVETATSEVTLTFPRLKKSAVAAIDGELIPLEKRVELRLEARGLKVFAPAVLARSLQEP
jgi:diacylglycerol kinase family enzyme